MSIPRVGTGLALVRWFDSWAGMERREEAGDERVDWLRCIPFIALHLSAFAVIWVGWSATALAVAVALYVVRMFAITAFYHRYFSHRSFKTPRLVQFLFALLGSSAVQRGPLWWAAHHRRHHMYSDESADPHSPLRRGFWWSHCGWFTSRGNFHTRLDLVRDLARFPELVFLDRFDALAPVILGGALYGCGALLEAFVPGLGTDGAQLLVWGILSTLVLYHGTFTINSLAHVYGTRAYATRDTSRNSLLLALLTLGEGWHNNHHRYPGAARQGFRRWELDPSYYGLVCLARLGLVSDLRPVPAHVLAEHGMQRLKPGDAA